MCLNKLQWAKMSKMGLNLSKLVSMSQNGPKYFHGTYGKMEAYYPKQCKRCCERKTNFITE